MIEPDHQSPEAAPKRATLTDDQQQLLDRGELRLDVATTGTIVASWGPYRAAADTPRRATDKLQIPHGPDHQQE